MKIYIGGTSQKKFQLDQRGQTPQHLSQNLQTADFSPEVKMLAEVLGCLPPLIKLKIFLVGLTNIYFHLEKVLSEDIKLLNSQKWGNNVGFQVHLLTD